MGTKVKEISPDRPDRNDPTCATCGVPNKVRHDEIWARAMTKTNYRVEFPADPRMR